VVTTILYHENAFMCDTPRLQNPYLLVFKGSLELVSLLEKAIIKAIGRERKKSFFLLTTENTIGL